MQVKRHCAVKYRMYPNRAQAALIDRTIGCARFIYNQMLETRIGTYKATGKSCNPTPAQYKDRYPFLRESSCFVHDVGRGVHVPVMPDTAGRTRPAAELHARPPAHRTPDRSAAAGSVGLARTAQPSLRWAEISDLVRNIFPTCRKYVVSSLL